MSNTLARGNLAQFGSEKNRAVGSQKRRYLRICEFVSLRDNFLTSFKVKAVDWWRRCFDSIPWGDFVGRDRFRACTRKLDFSTIFNVPSNRSGAVEEASRASIDCLDCIRSAYVASWLEQWSDSIPKKCDENCDF